MVVISFSGREHIADMLGEYAANTDAIIAKALNTAVKKSQKILPDIAAENYSFSPDASETPYTRKIMKISRAMNGKLNATLKYTTRATGLHYYQHTYSQASKGQNRYVKVAVHKGSARNVEGAFVVGFGSAKHKMIFKRDSNAKFKKSKKGKWGGYPIHKLNSVPVGAMFNNDRVVSAFEETSMKEYEAALQKYIKSIIRRGNRAKTQAAKAVAAE
jgi:hypothetical protein